MLLGKIYAILIYGSEGAEGKILEFHWTMLLNILVLIWIGCLVILFSGELENWTDYAGVSAIAIAIPAFFVGLGIWGRKKSG